MSGFSNFLTNFNGSVNIYGSLNDLMSNAILVPSLNNTTLLHNLDGFIYLSNLLIQFSATTNLGNAQINNTIPTFHFPISYAPFIVNITGNWISGNGSNIFVNLVSNSITNTSFQIRCSNSNGNISWVSIGLAPTYPVYTSITNSGNISNALSVAINGKGDKQYICGGNNIYTNYNYGYGTWTNISVTNLQAVKIVCSIDGTIVVVANQTATTTPGTYISTNSGSSFIQMTNFKTKTVACNADCSYIYVCYYDSINTSDNGKCYYSTNKSTLTQLTLPSNTKPIDIATNSSGNYVYIVTIDNKIFKSNDYGANWTYLSIQLPFNDLNNKKITVNSTGQYSAVCTSDEAGNNGYIFITLDYWDTYTVISTINKPWTSITSNSTGQYLCATNSNASGIYYSTDYGNNWINNTNYLSYYTSISMSSIGNIATAIKSDNVNVSFNAVN